MNKDFSISDPRKIPQRLNEAPLGIFQFYM